MLTLPNNQDLEDRLGRICRIIIRLFIKELTETICNKNTKDIIILIILPLAILHIMFLMKS